VVEGVGGRGDEAEVPVEAPGGGVLRVHRERTYPVFRPFLAFIDSRNR
jgi:hypothetical protein